MITIRPQAFNRDGYGVATAWDRCTIHFLTQFIAHDLDLLEYFKDLPAGWQLRRFYDEDETVGIGGTIFEFFVTGAPSPGDGALVRAKINMIPKRRTTNGE